MRELLDDIKHKLNCNFNDIQSFIHFVEYHNLHHYFETHPKISSDQQKVLKNLYQKKKLYNLLLLDEWNKILRATNNICPLYLYKGLSLSQQLYHDPLIRPTRDLDIFVNKKDIQTVDNILTSCGYKRIKPNFVITSKEFSYINKHIHHFTYINENNIIAELHWNVITPKSLFPNQDKLFHESKWENHLIRMPQELFLHFLIIHGSKHLWNRLIWLYDIQFLLTHHSIDWEKFNELKKIYKNDRMILICYYLLKNLFNTEIPISAQLGIKEEKIAQLCIESIHAEAEGLKQDNLSKIKRAYYRSMFVPGFKKLYLWLAGTSTQEDWEILKLPPYLFWLYYLLHPILWIISLKRYHKQ